MTLELPEDKLRAVNLVSEQRAWGAFTMEFYPMYDFIPVVLKNGAGEENKLERMNACTKMAVF